MNARLTPWAALLLIIPPLMWAGNAIVGRMVAPLIPPVTLNFVRWFFALLILIPLARPAFGRGSGLLSNWRRYAVLGLLGVGLYNGFQYLALHTSSPLNVTLVGASMPIWMMMIGALFFRAPVTRWQVLGALLSIAGVVVVLAHGDWRQLAALRFVAGDILMLIATLLWALYSWLLANTADSPIMRSSWATLLLAQVLYGVGWSAAFAGVEWVATDWTIHWNATLVLALIYVVLGPALLAYRCWGEGVRQVGPALAGVFFNLTPIFAAVMSALWLGDPPQWHHGVAFLLIVCGIFLSARRAD